MAPPSAPNDELLSTILFLINNHYWCALYELYVDARRLNVLDADLPSLNTLKSFFNDSKRFPDGVFRAVVARTPCRHRRGEERRRGVPASVEGRRHRERCCEENAHFCSRCRAVSAL